MAVFLFFWAKISLDRITLGVTLLHRWLVSEKAHEAMTYSSHLFTSYIFTHQLLLVIRNLRVRGHLGHFTALTAHIVSFLHARHVSGVWVKDLRSQGGRSAALFVTDVKGKFYVLPMNNLVLQQTDNQNNNKTVYNSRSVVGTQEKYAYAVLKVNQVRSKMVAWSLKNKWLTCAEQQIQIHVTCACAYESESPSWTFKWPLTVWHL